MDATGLRSALTAIAGRAAAPAATTWEDLSGSPVTEAVADAPLLPEPARRYLDHAIGSRLPAARAAVLEMEGQIRIGRWLPFRAVQLHAPPHGYVWAARSGWGPFFVSGYDSIAHGLGEMRWALAGRIPLVKATGRDVSRSAAGRVALDAIFTPFAFRFAMWHATGSKEAVIASWLVAGEREAVELRVDERGRPTQVTMQRWGNPLGQPYSRYPCGGLIVEEATFGGVTIPSEVRAGWFFGTDRWERGEFFRAHITKAVWL